jgi:hypothetical protein
MAQKMSLHWHEFDVRVVRGHQVASGRGGDPRFPGGTLGMQMPYFKALGLDLSGFYLGTINVSIVPCTYRVLQPRCTLTAVKWHPVAPAETFSFFDVRLIRDGKPPVDGLIYFPHPETKPEHFQTPDVLELLFPYVDGLALASQLRIAVPREQMYIAVITA